MTRLLIAQILFYQRLKHQNTKAEQNVPEPPLNERFSFLVALIFGYGSIEPLMRAPNRSTIVSRTLSTREYEQYKSGNVLQSTALITQPKHKNTRTRLLTRLSMMRITFSM